MLVCLLWSANALADDANYSIIGGAGSFRKNRHVRMVKEDVRIDMSDKNIHVRATFWFANEGPRTVVTMAFPDETTLEGPAARHGITTAISRFSSSVDGKAVTVRRRSVHQPKDPEMDISVKAVWVKRVPFEKDQHHVVKVDYVAANGIEGGGFASNSYVLKTGSTWKGRISACRITVDWSKVHKYSKPSLEFDGGDDPPTPRWIWTRPTRATTTLRNIKPDYDLDLSMMEGFWNFTLNGEPLSIDLGTAGGVEDSHPTGKPQDIKIAVSDLGGFFGDLSDGVKQWKNPVAKSFGSRIDLVDANHVRLGWHKNVALARPAEGPLPGSHDFNLSPTYIYLRDLVRALCGTYTYVPSRREIDIKLPLSRRKAKHR